MTIKNHAPKTVREQLFYILGKLYDLEQPNADGYVNIEINSLMDDLEFALQLAHNEKLPKITYRDVELPKGTLVSSTDYPVKRVGVVDYPQTTAESVKL